MCIRDSGGSANGGVDQDQIANTITFDVLNVNDPPAGTDNNISIIEDALHTFTAADFGFSDLADGDTFDAVTVSPPASGSLTLAGSPVTSTRLVSISAINNGSLVYTPAPGANGNNFDSLLFDVVDNGGIANGGINIDQTCLLYTSPSPRDRG